MSGTLQATILKDGASSTNNLTFDSSGNATVGNNLTVTGTSTLNGNTSVTGTITGSSTIAAATGTLYPLVSGTSQASTSGTSITFTGIPSWVKRITVSVSNLTGSGSSPNIIQLGTGAGPTYTTTGYLASATALTTTGATTAFTAGFPVVQSQTSSYVKSGVGVLTLVDSATNTWAWSGTFAFSTGSTGTFQAGGYVALSGVLTALQLTTVNGTDTFVSGKVNILYE